MKKRIKQFTNYGLIWYWIVSLIIVIINFYISVLLLPSLTGLLIVVPILCAFTYGYHRGKYPLKHLTQEYYDKIRQEQELLENKIDSWFDK